MIREFCFATACVDWCVYKKRTCDTIASSPKRVRVGEAADDDARNVEVNEVSTVSGAAVINEDEDESESVGNAAAAEPPLEETWRLKGGGG